MDANDGLWIVGGAWWLIFVQVYSLVRFGMEWNWSKSEEHHIWVFVRKTFERSFERLNVETRRWLAGMELSNVLSECSNVEACGWFGVGRCRVRTFILNVQMLNLTSIGSETSNVRTPLLDVLTFDVTGILAWSARVELSTFDWCLGRFPRRLLNHSSDFREPYTVGKLIECRIQWYVFRDDRRSGNEVMTGINNSDHVLLETRLLT